MKSASPLAGVDNALCILHRLALSGAAGTSLTRLAADLGMNKTSVHRMLKALQYRDFARQESSGNYRLGPASFRLTDAYLQDKALQGVFHDGLKDLCGKAKEICHLAVLMDEEIVYIDKLEPPNPIGTWSKVGWRNPAISTALGRALISQQFVDFESFTARFSDPIEQRTAFTRTNLKAVWQELVEARRRGFAMEEQEFCLGVSCVAAAISRGPTIVASISITGPSDRVHAKSAPRLIALLDECITPHLPPGLTLQKPLIPAGRKKATSDIPETVS